MIPPRPLILFFFRVGKFYMSLQKNFWRLRPRTPKIFKRFWEIQVFHSENIETFLGSSAPEPPIFQLFRI